MSFIINGIQGFCMALADSVPGVSGGTVAYILGFYDKLINSLNDLLYGDKKKKIEAIKFLIKLGIGWLIGMMLAILILTSLFENHIYAVSSLFIGFVIAAIPLIVKEEKDNLVGKYKNIIFLILGVLIVALITYFNPISGNDNIIDISHINLGLALYIFISGAIAIAAMVLPGISGSTLLLIFGLYIPIISAVKEILQLNFSLLPALLIFLIGVISGVAVSIRLIKVALDSHRSAMTYFILGLMLGSIYAIIMGPTTIGVTSLSINTFNILFFIIGCLIIIGLEKVKVILSKKQIKE